MNLYLVDRSEADPGGWDEFISMVVCAESEDAARHMSPDPECAKHEWVADVATLDIALIGTAADHLLPGPVLTYFRHG